MATVDQLPPLASMASLYVGDLTPDANESHLYATFSGYGAVVSVKICRDGNSQISLCYGYVNYRTKAEAEKAIKSANHTLIDGKPCRVMWSIRDPNKRKMGVGNLYVKNIHPDLDSRALCEAFSSFGPVMSCKIAQDQYGMNKGFGFVQFYNEADSNDAIERVNGVDFRGKKLYVSKFIPKSSRVPSTKSDPSKFTNVFVKNFGVEWTLDELKNRFKSFGEITSAVVQKDSDMKPLGYGFVNFADSECALKAVEQMNNLDLGNGNKLYVNRAMKKNERRGYLRKVREDRKREMHEQYKNQNLYVKNFDETFTEDMLRAEFAPFGAIRSIQIMKDENQRSKCFGFVCFANANQAHEALTSLHGKILDGKPLYVAVAQTKDERRKYLENQRVSAAYRGTMGMAFPQIIPYVYPPPQQFPYHSQYQNYRGAHGGGRSGSRGGMIAPQHMGTIPPQNVRYPYMYQPNAPYVHPQYRPRSQQPNQTGGRGDRQSGGGRYHQGSAQYRQPQVHSSQAVNEHPPKRDDRPSVRADEDMVGIDIGDRVYRLCQEVFSRNHYDMNKLERVSGSFIIPLSFT